MGKEALIAVIKMKIENILSDIKKEEFKTINDSKNKKVLLGMSGGVDSSLSALLLKQQGYDVIGSTLELYAGSSCCNINTYLDAKNVCNQIEIPNFTFNYKDEFKKHVIDDFIDCYSNFKTPNTCI